MEDWHDVASLVTSSLTVASIVAVSCGILLYTVLRIIHLVSRFRANATWRTDLRPPGQLALVTLAVVFLPSFGIGYMFSDMCGTSDITEVLSPDAKHKIVVYNFDCGATTAFSLDVSLLRSYQKLPKYRTATLLYHHYRQFPSPNGDLRNFEVYWNDSAHVTVRIEGLDNTAKSAQQDGIQISFEKLH